jgi:hypothetical protein
MGVREIFEESNDIVVTMHFQNACGKVSGGVRRIWDGIGINIVCWRSSRGISREVRSVSHDIRSEEEI